MLLRGSRHWGGRTIAVCDEACAKKYDEAEEVHFCTYSTENRNLCACPPRCNLLVTLFRPTRTRNTELDITPPVPKSGLDKQ